MSKLNDLANKTVCLAIDNIKIGDLIVGLDDSDDAKNVIMALDLNREDCDFTTSLIIDLFKSLRGDLDKNEGKDLINKLKKINKDLG